MGMSMKVTKNRMEQLTQLMQVEMRWMMTMRRSLKSNM